MEASISSVDGNSKKYGLTWWDIWALGITIVIGGQYFSWNVGLVSGFGSFMISTILMGFAYICLCSCTSELSSTFPFAGGAFGLARCTMGFYFGFLVGASEATEYIFYVSLSVIFLTSLFCVLSNDLVGFEPFVWLAFYVISCIIYIFCGLWFWRFNMFLAVTSILILVFYCFGSMSFTNLSRYGQYADLDSGWFVGGSTSFMLSFPLSAWFYVGIESLNMTCDDIDNPKQNIPKGQMFCILTLFVTSMLTLIVTAALPPGIEELSSAYYPLNNGFSLILNTTSDMVLILSIPATFATAFGFMYSYSRMISAMSLSNIWPKQFGAIYSKTGAPCGGVLVGSVLSYITCFSVYYNNEFKSILFNVCILAAFMTYSAQCIGYIALQTRYSNLPRQFKSPFGIPGAVFSLCVWILGIICVIFFQQDNYMAVSIYTGIIGVLSLYYFIYARKRLTLSEEEQAVFFVVHVINNNNNRRKTSNKSKLARAASIKSERGSFKSKKTDSNISSQQHSKVKLCDNNNNNNNNNDDRNNKVEIGESIKNINEIEKPASNINNIDSQTDFFSYESSNQNLSIEKDGILRIPENSVLSLVTHTSTIASNDMSIHWSSKKKVTPVLFD